MKPVQRAGALIAATVAVAGVTFGAGAAPASAMKVSCYSAQAALSAAETDYTNHVLSVMSFEDYAVSYYNAINEIWVRVASYYDAEHDTWDSFDQPEDKYFYFLHTLVMEMGVAENHLLAAQYAYDTCAW